MKQGIAIVATALLCTVSDGKGASDEATIYTSIHERAHRGVKEPLIAARGGFSSH
jgi:hypothetical protein